MQLMLIMALAEELESLRLSLSDVCSVCVRMYTARMCGVWDGARVCILYTSMCGVWDGARVCIRYIRYVYRTYAGCMQMRMGVSECMGCMSQHTRVWVVYRWCMRCVWALQHIRCIHTHIHHIYSQIQEYTCTVKESTQKC